MAVPLVAALTVFALPGVADAKKKRDKIGVATFNLYLGSDLADATRAGQQNRTDLFADEVGRVLSDVNANDFTVRARAIAAQIRKKEVDLIGLQEAALWKVQIPTDGGAPSARNPNATRAGLVVYDYIEELVDRLNKKAKTKKECADERQDANRTPGDKDDRKAEDCYRGYKLVVTAEEADLEFPGDFDNNPGPDGRTCDLSSGTCPPPPPSDSWTWGNDDTGVSFGEPPSPPFPPDANFDNPPHNGASDAGATDCPDSRPTGVNPLAIPPFHPAWGAGRQPVCMFHGIDGDVSLQMRDAILKRKGAGVKTKNSTAGNFSPGNLFRVNVFGSPLFFTRGWTATDAKVRGKKFRFVNTHLESESAGTFREDQASELLAGPASDPRTVLVGDLNSDPNRVLPPGNNDGGSSTAIHRLYAGGYRSLAHRPEGIATGSHGDHGDIINDEGDVIQEGWIDHILTNSEDIEAKGKAKYLDKFKRGLWTSDHAGLFVRILGKMRDR